MSSPTTTTTTTSTTTPLFISTTTLHSILSHKTLITHFQTTLPNATLSLSTPPRHSHSTSQNSTLLLMPSFSTSPSLPYTGVKIVTAHPQNRTLNLPRIHASYTLFSSLTGQTLALFDATQLTHLRTSSISALASLYLSKIDAKILVMVGSGDLSPHLITAHLIIRPSINQVIIWNRTAERAVKLANKFRVDKNFEGVSFETSENLDEVVGLGDIVSCATSSVFELVRGERLKEGAHVDLVGSFKPAMKECDDEAVRRGRVFVDNEAAFEEAGELVGGFERGVICKEDCGTLVDLIKGDKVGRVNDKEITVFKSVGSGVFDLLAAQLVYETVIRDQKVEH